MLINEPKLKDPLDHIILQDALAGVPEDHPYQAFIKSTTARFGHAPSGIASFQSSSGLKGAYGVARALGASSIEAFAVTIKLSSADGNYGRVVAALIDILRTQRKDTSEACRICEFYRLTDAIVTGIRLEVKDEQTFIARGLRLDREYCDLNDEYQRTLRDVLRSERWTFEIVDCRGVRGHVRIPNLDAVYLTLLRHLANPKVPMIAAIEVVETVLVSGEAASFVVNRAGARQIVEQYEYFRATIIALASEILHCNDYQEKVRLIDDLGQLMA